MARREYVKALSGQDLIVRITEGRPSATPTVAILDEGGSTISAAAVTNVTLDTANTTLAAESAAGAKTLTLASATGVQVGRLYVITNASGQSELVRVAALASVAVTLDKALEYTYPITTSTFVGTYVSYALQTIDVAQLRERMQAVIAYTVDGEKYTRRELYDVCLYVLHNPLTREVLTSRSPDISIAEWAEQQHSDFERQRAVAWDKVCTAIRQKGKRPALIADVNDLIPWAMAELALLLQRGGVRVVRDLDPSEALADLKEQRTQERDAALGCLSWYDASEDGAADDSEVNRPRPLDFVR